MGRTKHASALVVGALALIVALATAAVRGTGPDAHGRVSAAARERFDVADDVVAMLEEGAAFGYGVDGAGVHVEQIAGRVLYRASEGARLDVATGRVSVACRGECAIVVEAPDAALRVIEGDVDVRGTPARAAARDDDDNALASIDDRSAAAVRALHEALARAKTLRSRLAAAR